MSKIITKEELIALYNEIETLRLKAKDEMERKINKEGYILSDDDILEVKRIYQNIDREIIEWIVGKRKFKEISEHKQENALNILFQRIDGYTHREKKFAVIQEFLSATKNPMFVEIAEKLKMFQEKDINKNHQKIVTGVMLLNLFDSKEKITQSYEYHYRTIKSESKEITRRQKKASKNEQEKIRKFRNIYSIQQQDLYIQIIKFLREHGCYPHGLYDGDEINQYLINHIEEIVYEHQHEAIKMLRNLDYLQFAEEQKIGKIR